MPELTPNNTGCSQLACDIVKETFLSLDGFAGLRNQMNESGSYSALHFGSTLARIVDREIEHANDGNLQHAVGARSKAM